MSKTVVFANANSKIQRVQIGEKVGGEGGSRGDVVKSKHGGYRLGTGEVTIIAEGVGESSRMGRRKSTSKADKEDSANGSSRRSSSRGKQSKGPDPGLQPGGDNDAKDNRLKVAQKSDISTKNAEVCHDQPKPKPTIQEFYQEKGGISYGHVRRMNKMGIGGTGISRTNQVLAVVDFYTPPPGYGKSDLPDIKDVLSQSSEEQPMSPAVTICKKSKRAVRPASKSSEADYKTFLSKLKLGQGNCKTNKKDDPTSPLNQRTLTAATAMNYSFPEDSLNDEDCFLASQQVENAQEDLKNQLVPQVRKRDFNGNCKNTFTCDTDCINPNSPPLTSTPVATTSGNTSKKVGPKITRETPSRPSLSRGRRLSKREATFETSTENLDPSRKDESNDDEAEAPKLGKALKYDDLGSPIKPVTNHDISKCGDIPDDDMDNIFSQIEIPGESKKDDMNHQITTKIKGGFFETSTSMNTGEGEEDGEDEKDGKDEEDCEEMGSILSESQMDAFLQLEEIHCDPGPVTEPTTPTTVTGKVTLSTPYKPPRPMSSHNDSSEDSPTSIKEPSSTQRRRMGSTRRVLRHTPTKMT